MKELSKVIETICTEVANAKKYKADADTALEVIMDSIPDEYDKNVAIEYFLELNAIVDELIKNEKYNLINSDVSIEDIEAELLRRGFSEFYYLDRGDLDGDGLFTDYYLTIDIDDFHEEEGEFLYSYMLNKLCNYIEDYNIKYDTDFTIEDLEKFWEIYQVEISMDRMTVMDMYSLKEDKLNIINAFHIIYGNEKMASEGGKKKVNLVYEYIYSDVSNLIRKLCELVGDIDSYDEVMDVLLESMWMDYFNGWGFVLDNSCS